MRLVDVLSDLFSYDERFVLLQELAVPRRSLSAPGDSADKESWNILIYFENNNREHELWRAVETKRPASLPSFSEAQADKIGSRQSGGRPDLTSPHSGSAEPDPAEHLIKRILWKVEKQSGVFPVCALPSASRVQFVGRMLTSLRDAGFTLACAFGCSRVNAAAGDSGEALLSEFAEGLCCEAVRTSILRALEASRRTVLFIHSFVPPFLPSESHEQEWTGFTREIRRLSQRAPVILVQSANPFHFVPHRVGSILSENAIYLHTVDSSGDAMAAEGFSPREVLAHIFSELRPCCRRAIGGRYDSENPCIRALQEARIVEEGADGKIAPVSNASWGAHWYAPKHGSHHE